MPLNGRTTTSVIWGALFGAGAYLVGYLVTYVWHAQAVSDAIRGINVIAELFGTASIPTWKAVGWLFYGEHFVDTLFPTFGGDTMVNIVEHGDGMEVLYLLPPALLVVAGAVSVLVSRVDEARDGAIGGAAIVVGYLPLVTIGAFVVAHGIAGTGRSIQPDIVTAVLLAGAVYPLVFGGIGGFLASLR